MTRASLGADPHRCSKSGRPWSTPLTLTQAWLRLGRCLYPNRQPKKALIGLPRGLARRATPRHPPIADGNRPGRRGRRLGPTQAVPEEAAQPRLQAATEPVLLWPDAYQPTLLSAPLTEPRRDRARYWNMP